LNKERIWIKEPGIWLIFFLYLAAAAFSFNRGLLLSDEGYQLYFSWLISRGQKIYKDFFLQVAPLSYLIQALLIKIFGLKIIVSRIYALLLGIAGFFGIAYISKKIVPGRFWLASASLYIFFSNNLFNFSHYSVESRLELVLSLAFALSWFDSRRLIMMFFSGLFAAMAAASYQSFTALAGLELIIFIAFRDKDKNPDWLKPLAAYVGGFAVVGFAVGAYLAYERLLQEAFSALVFSATSKGHIYYALIHLVLPIMAAAVALTIFLSRPWHEGAAVRFLSSTAITLILGIAGAYIIVKRTFILPHLISLLVVTAGFTLSAVYLEREGTKRQWLVWAAGVGLFLLGLLSGHDLQHNLASSILLVPWAGFLVERWKRSSRIKTPGLSPAGIVVMVFLFAASIYLFATRIEFYGDVEPLYRCNSALEIGTARGIYTSRAQKLELETLVRKTEELTKPGDKILVYPNYLLIYNLCLRASVSPRPYFFYELAEINALDRAVNAAIQSKSLVIFQLKNGEIFQPLESKRAGQLIAELSDSCSEKTALQNYLICAHR